MVLFLDQATDKELIEEMHKRGYKVIKNEDFKKEYEFASQIITIKDLNDHFYGRRRYYNADRKFPLCRNLKKDNKFISEFVKSREKLGRDHPTAVAEAASLIDALFKYEKFLKLKEPITDPLILTYPPIMDRVCNYLNGEVVEVNETETVAFADEAIAEYRRKFGKQSFEDGKEERKRILEKLDGNKKRK